MAEIGFTIPGTESYVSANTDIIPDKGLARNPTARIRVVKFGDGYEQRLVDGINFIEETYTLNFATRPKEDIDDIMAFFDSRSGASFDFRFPDSNGSGTLSNGDKFSTIKVVVDKYGMGYDYGDFYSCKATFRRVYEA